MSYSKKYFIKTYLKAFTLTALAIIFVSGLALADTNTKEVAGYMGDNVLQVAATPEGIDISLFGSGIVISKPDAIGTASVYINDGYNKAKEIYTGAGGVWRFIELIFAG